MAKNKHTFWNLADRLEGDKVVWVITLMLILLSAVCLFSSTSRLLESGQTRIDIVRSQLITIAAGLAIIIVLYNIRNINVFRFLAPFGFPLSLALLAILDLHQKVGPFEPIKINEVYRILSVGGVQVHVFEVVKVAMVMYLAWAMDALEKRKIKWPANLFARRLIFVYLPFIVTMLAVIPGSNSSALFIGGIMFIVILLGGGSRRDMLVLAAAALLVVSSCFGIYKLSDGKYMTRIGTGISRVTEKNNWADSVMAAKPYSDDYYRYLDKIRQPYGAKIAIKEGGIVGKGPGQSTQRYMVPDMSEDYMFSFIVEEYGLLGGILVILLYVSLLARGSLIARNCGSDLFAKISVAGLSLLIVLQAFLHITVNADIGPMTGQTLPLVSHGKSAFLCFCVAFGVILSISRMMSDRMKKEQKNAEPIVEPQIEQEDGQQG